MPAGTAVKMVSSSISELSVRPHCAESIPRQRCSGGWSLPV